MTIPRDPLHTLFAVIGADVSRSKSPAVHNAAFAAVGLRARLVAISTNDARTVVKQALAAGYGGLAVTRPHKSTVLAALTDVFPEAQSIGAVNTIRFQEGRAVGTNTDVWGIRQALLETGTTLEAKRVAIIGAGGTARAAIAACRLGAALEVRLLAGRIDQARELARDKELVGELTAQGDELGSEQARMFLKAADVLIQTTPVGSHSSHDQMPLDPGALRSDVVLLDVVYDPLPTALMRRVRARGGIAIGGDRMFLHQAAAQFHFWTGQTAPFSVMERAFKEGD
jgi:shikimate dehydrogenase